PDDLDEPEVHGQIVLPLARRGPAGLHRDRLAPQLVADADAGGGPMLLPERPPPALLRARSRRPVPPDEGVKQGGVARGHALLSAASSPSVKSLLRAGGLPLLSSWRSTYERPM